MTKYFELNWKIPVPPQLQEGTVGDRWVEDKENFDCEPDCKFKVDDCGFFLSWKSEGKVLETCGLLSPKKGGFVEFIFQKHPPHFLNYPYTICTCTHSPKDLCENPPSKSRHDYSIFRGFYILILCLQTFSVIMLEFLMFKWGF